MKQLLLSFATLVFTICAFAQKKADDVAKFTSETIDLGNIKQNEPTTATFEVTNIGTEPLLIETANPTCGCTISDFTKTPIEPGKVGTIKATYNAKNLNAFEKHLTVKFAGTDDLKSITIKGNVVAAEAPAGEKAEAVPTKAEMIDNVGGIDLPAGTDAKKEVKAASKTAPAKVADKKAASKSSGTIKAADSKKSENMKKPQ
jgi:hypothetical protein